MGIKHEDYTPEIVTVLTTLYDNHVEPTQEIKDLIDETISLQLVHDMICTQLDLLREETTDKIMAFFLEWKMEQE